MVRVTASFPDLSDPTVWTLTLSIAAISKTNHENRKNKTKKTKKNPFLQNWQLVCTKVCNAKQLLSLTLLLYSNTRMGNVMVHCHYHCLKLLVIRICIRFEHSGSLGYESFWLGVQEEYLHLFPRSSNYSGNQWEYQWCSSTQTTGHSQCRAELWKIPHSNSNLDWLGGDHHTDYLLPVAGVMELLVACWVGTESVLHTEFGSGVPATWLARTETME